MRSLSLLFSHTNNDIKYEQVRLLFHQGSTIILLGILTALIPVSMFWNYADQGLLKLWFIIFVLLSFARLYLNYTFTKYEEKDFLPEWWALFYIIGTFLSGITWGTLAFFYDTNWPVVQQLTLFVVYTGIIGGSMNTNSSVFVAFPAFYIPAVLLLMIATIPEIEYGKLSLSTLFVIYIVLMYVSAKKFNRRLINALELSFENEKMAYELFKKNEQLDALSKRDGLTHLQNRRSMENFLNEIWNNDLLKTKPLSMLFIDIDHFKNYNDTYGHYEGDKCLINIADVLNSHLRPNKKDMAARFGGEEFAVILPDTDEKEALSIAKAIKEEVNDLHIQHSSSNIKPYVTLSMGIVCQIPEIYEHHRDFAILADKALYKAKEKGRDTIVVSDINDV